MPRRRKRRKAKKNITINKFTISFTLLGIGSLYFLTLFYAKNSPIFSILDIPSSLMFGKWGSLLFFGGFIIIGILILLKEDVLRKSIFKKFFLLIIISTAILDFPILDGGEVSSSVADKGGYLGRLLLFASGKAFGYQTAAIKIFFIALLVILLVLIIISLDLKPSGIKINFDIKEPKPKKGSTKGATNSGGSLIKSIFSKEAKAATLNENSENKVNKQAVKQLLKSRIKEKIDKKVIENEYKQISFPQDKPTYSITLLDESYDDNQFEIDEEYLMKNARSVQNKLEEFGIPVTLQGFNIGPTVIQIKIKPKAGIKISKIESVKKDLSLALKTKSIRILAPIPGTGTVGIEIPNPKPRIVRLREIMEAPEFKKQMSDNFTNLSIGIGIDGKKIIKSLEKMPHLLVAGATGSGKSVGINDFILSLMYQNTPAEMKFIMVDPKQVELGMYEGIPYLLSPIITEPDKAVKVLKWAVDNMNERYQLLKKHKVKHIDEYNKKFKSTDEKLYRIVIIIDELADLMMSGKKRDNEIVITRLAQKSRAVGIHLILATQRPSVNVVTGLIKANIPTRIAFGVTQLVDSRTILDMKGAEDLVGKGDLLYIDPSNKYPIRIQAPYADTLEIEKIVNSIKGKYMKGVDENKIYHPEIINILESKAEMAGGGKISGDDEILASQATEIISETRKASATLLQRKLGIGFARASRIMDILEERGIVGPQDGAKPREIYI